MKLEWISVKQKLPDKYKRVLVTDGKEVCLHYKQSRFNFAGAEGEDLLPIGDLKDPDGKWIDCCDIGSVTHWMYLPENPNMPIPDIKEKNNVP